jgi:hypothetical protein
VKHGAEKLNSKLSALLKQKLEFLEFELLSDIK